MAAKKEIRLAVLKARRNLSQQETMEKSSHICESVVSHPWFQKAKTVLLYMDYNREVMTGQIIERAWELGKCVGVPKVHGKTMEYYRIESFEDLEEGAYGIREPRKECPRIQTEGAKRGDILAVMPGVAFDSERNRIGYGGGYYDKYFEKKDNINKMAVAFELQMVPCIDAEEFDLKPDCIVTEKQLYCPD
ncbi:5-formyltetrahydrofolate cyclo-ligase [Bariatricus massiliensis]|uniref:5-formyltetrahydrofolate cyclo-ligase n=1 Tax=Bariatricus massiliensis TaxID=1745713 RepID=A0ABS8DCD7_9FIRM|nr:5-formyltetrahydrofolate cyclo-ligase [Bariatricus massiliensis]MCB7303265.1 5-formyltetrahydrofolate cyclo-ligase [Bariatricus massiliensis]MCB7373397.1 5-formyltetrahydrofolate cyclo-ligase [Bariatricus massiliensis]MCB7386067.1 5-formyltetrahydrofolate cyclo-ligase [Bariatricus massiliensis]MCB7410229.1 5-formyltetrahydrofolate cyclo-ligase [Bariatricus massiliensis]MCQ5252487.1 5-formyltetrahydrofolate cyclo-ligase [Bariatricus massiliensis]